jgi:hypothetical protein
VVGNAAASSAENKSLAGAINMTTKRLGVNMNGVTGPEWRWIDVAAIKV